MCLFLSKSHLIRVKGSDVEDNFCSSADGAVSSGNRGDKRRSLHRDDLSRPQGEVTGVISHLLLLPQ